MRVGTAKKKSRLRIDVDPDSAADNYRVTIQRKVGQRWRKVQGVRTRGDRDVVVVDLRRGKYRVVLPAQDLSPAHHQRSRPPEALRRTRCDRWSE